MGWEKLRLEDLSGLAVGSPPRRRGKGQDLWHDCRSVGITPAWAGKRRCISRTNTSAGDHPRVGGEKPSFFVVFSRRLGSPPRGRGKEISRDGTGYRLGITPAWAGKRFPGRGKHRHRQDHPRVGGEKCGQQKQNRTESGSPPRGRGKVGVAAHRGEVLGITPAWAGKSVFQIP